MIVRKRPDEITITVTATARKENRRMRARRLCIVTWGVGERVRAINRSTNGSSRNNAKEEHCSNGRI